MIKPFNNRKEQIVLTALHIVSEQGVTNLTMKNIAHKIGFSDAALYRHFKNKQQLMKEMILTAGRNLNIEITNSVSDIEDPVEKLKEILHIHLSYLAQNKGIPRLIFSEDVHQNDPLLRRTLLKIVNHYLDMIRGILWRAKDTGQVKPDIDIEATAVAFLGLVQATTFIWSLSNFEFSISERAPGLWCAFAEKLG